MLRPRWAISTAGWRALRPLVVPVLLAAVAGSGCMPLLFAAPLLGSAATPNQANIAASDAARREARQREARQLEQEALGARQRGRYWDAADKTERALALREVDGAQTFEAGEDLGLLAQLHFDLHRRQAAEPYLKRALAVWDRQVDSHPAEVLAVLEEHNALLRDLGMSTEAHDLAERAHARQAETQRARERNRAVVLASLFRLTGCSSRRAMWSREQYDCPSLVPIGWHHLTHR